MESRYPRSWDWERQKAPRPLSAYEEAPEAIGVYELGYMNNGKFEPMYVGRAMGVNFRQRFYQHYKLSHNVNVRKNRSKLFFRYKRFPSENLAAYVEAVLIAALDYPWNKRNEWAQHFRLEK